MRTGLILLLRLNHSNSSNYLFAVIGFAAQRTHIIARWLRSHSSHARRDKQQPGAPAKANTKFFASETSHASVIGV